MTRFVTRSTKGLAAAALALGLTLAPVKADVSMGIAEARQIAAASLAQGQPQLAAQIATGLLQRDPSDAYAHFVLARAFQQMQQPKLARRQAALAYRHADTGLGRYQASQLAATLAVELAQPGMAQIWLRRSWNHAPDDRAREVLKRDYRVLRALNPWNVQLRLSMAPSDNVNNGAEDPYAVIAGVPWVGVLSGDAMALSGLKMTGDLSLGYRFTQTDHSQTRVTGRLYLSRVALSADARAQAPTAENSDFAYTKAELGLEHRRSLGKEAGLLSAELTLSRQWYGGQPLQNSLRIEGARVVPLAPGKQVQLSLAAERSQPERGAPVTEMDLRASVSAKLSGGGTFSYGASLQLADSLYVNARRQRATGFVAWGLPRPIGPAKVSLSLGGTVADYPDYRVGPFVVPGGRQDHMLFGSADFVFENLDYAGFVPSLKVQAQKTRSNVSRFETNEFSVSLGIVSRF